MPRVNVEQKVFTDPRFSHLGQLLGTNRYEAIGRMTVVWSVCTEQNWYVLPIDVLNHIFDDVDHFADLVVLADLGRKKSHGIYIRGTRGRIEWLERKRRASRENGKKGGRPRKTELKPKKNRRRFPTETAPSPVPALALVPAKGMVPSSPSPPPQDDDDVAIIRRVVEAVAPQVGLDDTTVKHWLTTIAEGDVYWIAACVLESATYVSRATSPKYIESVLLNRRRDGWCCEDARGYVEYQLGKFAARGGLPSTSSL